MGDRAAALSWPFRSVGDTVGRYRLLDRIGRGGMGVVHRAFDPELDREVALKLLRPDLMKSAEERARLVREAQAMAQLAHPNVVAVYDVGCADSVWIAMELVHGGTLRDWLTARPRTPGAIVDVLAQAGRGLAAAHAVGIVHRDFKPSNVMVGDDGRVRVMDFGLASSAARALPSVASGEGLASDSSESLRVLAERSGSLEQSLTATGIVVGTPAYMAPEQHAGDRADARVDQYALAIALWEALCGARPFGGDDLDALVEAKLAGVARPPAGVAKHVGRALVRALAVRPEDRFGEMSAFVDAFAVPPRPRWLGAAVGATAIAAIAAVWTIGRPADARVCPARERAQTVWGERREALADVSGDEAVTRLDEHVGALVDVHEETCAHVARDDLSPALLEARRRCVDARWAELDVIAQAWSQPPSPGAHAIDGVLDGMAAPSACADEVRPALVVPSDPATRERIGAIHVRLAEASAHSRLGRPDHALEMIADLPAAAAAVGDAETTAFVERQIGSLNGQMGRPDVAEPHLSRAYDLAMEAGHDELASELAVELVRVVGVDLGRRDDADTWARHAQSLIDRTGDQGTLGWLENQRGILDQIGNRPERAFAHHERAVALLLETDGYDHFRSAIAMSELANAARQNAAYEEAVEYAAEALAMMTDISGADHPLTLQLLGNLGHCRLTAGDLVNARVDLVRSADGIARTMGTEHPAYATAVMLLGEAEWEAGDRAVAVAHTEQSLVLAAKIHGGEHDYVAETSAKLGLRLLAMGEPARAHARFELAIPVLERKQVAGSQLEAVHTLLGAAQASLALEQSSRAVRELVDAERILVALAATASAELGHEALADAELWWCELAERANLPRERIATLRATARAHLAAATEVGIALQAIE